jgi:hypothetical protein
MVCTGRKEREKERESARGRGKEERKTSAEAVGGASAATVFSQGAFSL